jgi:hypothetical protein
MLFHRSSVLFLQLLSQGSTDMPALLTEVTHVPKAVAATEAFRVMVVHGVDTSAWEAAGAGVKSRGGDHHGVSLCSQGCRRLCPKDCAP